MSMSDKEGVMGDLVGVVVLQESTTSRMRFVGYGCAQKTYASC